MNIICEELEEFRECDKQMWHISELVKIYIANGEKSILHLADAFSAPPYVNEDVEVKKKSYRSIFNNFAKVEIKGCFEWNWGMYAGNYSRHYDKLINSLKGTTLTVLNPLETIVDDPIYGSKFKLRDSFCSKIGDRYFGYFRNEPNEPNATEDTEDTEDTDSFTKIMQAVYEIFSNGDVINYLILPKTSYGFRIIKDNILEEVAFEIGFIMFEMGKPFIFIKC